MKKEYRNPAVLVLDAEIYGWRLVRDGLELFALHKGKEVAVAPVSHLREAEFKHIEERS